MRDHEVFSGRNRLRAELAEEAHAFDDRVPDVGPVLADAAGEREDVNAAQGHGHVGHCPGDPICVDREGERVVEAAEGREPGLVLQRRVELVDAQAALAQEVDERARVDGARRVAIGTPSSGLKPIVVSTERPSSTAVTEQPPPRWQATIRAASSCETTDCTAIPWNP